jgi:hypothetical protein
MRSRAADCPKLFRESSRVTTARGTTLLNLIEPFSHSAPEDELGASGLRLDNTNMKGMLLLYNVKIGKRFVTITSVQVSGRLRGKKKTSAEAEVRKVGLQR